MQLRNIHLRRIQWAIFSPSLLSYPFSANYVQDEQHRSAIIALLEALDAESTAVDEHFASLGNMPMGKYFEQLLFFILEKDDRFEILLKNQQIIEGGRTVGEIDLILKDTKTGEIEHWEIALKFYLQSKPTEDHAAMLGPNAVDNLARKMKKLTEHQLPIKANLSNLALLDNHQVSNKLLLKGQFFYHLCHVQTCNIFPNHVNPIHNSGWWCHLSEIEKAIDKNLVWTTLQKPNWIGKMKQHLNLNLLNFNDIKESLKQYFHDNSRAILCVGLKEQNGVWKEHSRGFVVEEDWPNGSKK